MKTQPRTDDPLAACLAQLAGAFSLRTDEAAILHGLPLSGGRLPLEHLDAAAARAGLELIPWTQPLRRLVSSYCPLLCVDEKTGAAFIITALEERKKGPPLVHVSGEERPHPLTEVLKHGTRVYLARPKETMDARVRELPMPRQAHWFWSALRLNSGVYGHAAAATMIVNILALAIPLTTMNVYDRVVANAAFTTLWSLAIGAALAAAFDLLLRTLRAVMLDRASARSDVVLANRIFARLLGARLTGRDVSVGVRANSLREFEALREFFNSATMAALGDLPFIALFLLVIAVIAGPLVRVPLVTIPIVLLAGWLTQARLNRIIARSFAGQAHKNAVAVESLSGIETLKAHAAESWAAGKWERATADHLRHSLKSRFYMALGSHFIGFSSSVSTIALLVYGVYLVTGGVITPGAMFAAMILNGRITQPLAQLAGLLTRLHQARMAFSALRQIAALPQEREEGARLLIKDAYDGALAFEGVTFVYGEDMAPALRDVTINIRPGEKVAVIGGMGSGKSTLLKLALGMLVPSSGQVLVDGLPASRIDPANLRAHAGALLQDATLFHGTIRENVTLNLPGASEERLMNALHVSCALDWIRLLPAGLDTPLGERGAGLSGGQKQTLCLARALLRDPEILLLDEPTSHMDGQMEQLFIRRMKERMKDKTLVLVTHKMPLLALAERLIVLERGKVLLDGPKEQVLARLKEITAERKKGAAA